MCAPGPARGGRGAGAGDGVTKFTQGDIVGVGCMVDSCRTCAACRAGNEQYCEGEHGFLATYNGPLKPDGTNTFGGYATRIVVTEDFVVRIPAGLEPHAAAPLLCSAVTTYSPLKRYRIGPGQTVGIVGIGGLGHIAIAIAKALGAEVVAFTRTAAKKSDAVRLGASEAVLSTDSAEMKRRAGTFDYILSTIPEAHDVNPYLKLLKTDGRITLVGVLAPVPDVQNNLLAFKRLSFGGSLIGSVAETQEILDFCATHGIAPLTELIALERINEAFDNVVRGAVRYRYVIAHDPPPPAQRSRRRVRPRRNVPGGLTPPGPPSVGRRRALGWRVPGRSRRDRRGDAPQPGC